MNVETLKPARIEEGTIRYHNDLADIPLIGMTASQANIFMAACYRYQHELYNTFPSVEDLENTYQEDIPCIEYNVAEYIKLCNYTKGGPKKFAEEARAVSRQLARLVVSGNENAEEEVVYPFFYEFVINKEKKTLLLQIHKRTAYMLFGLKETYTQHELEEFIRIKSIYAKRCYRQLKRWRTVGKWDVDMKTFETLMCLPESYRGGNLDKRVLVTIKDQLSPLFNDLKIEKKYGKGRGGPVTGLTFTFRPEPKNPASGKQSGIICPRCGKPLVEKKINGNNCWCHEDGWKEGAECSAIFNAVSDINEEARRQEGEGEIPKEIADRLSACFG